MTYSYKTEIPELRDASMYDYTDYLANFLNAGAKLHSISNADSYTQLCRSSGIYPLYVATADCDIPEHYGVDAIAIITEDNIHVTTGGHNQILSMSEPLMNSRRLSLLKVNAFAAALLKDRHGITLTPDHFKEPENDQKQEFLWQLDHINGCSLMNRFQRATSEKRLTAPVLKQRARNFVKAFDLTL